MKGELIMNNYEKIKSTKIYLIENNFYDKSTNTFYPFKYGEAMYCKKNKDYLESKIAMFEKLKLMGQSFKSATDGLIKYIPDFDKGEMNILIYSYQATDDGIVIDFDKLKKSITNACNFVKENCHNSNCRLNNNDDIMLKYHCKFKANEYIKNLLSY